MCKGSHFSRQWDQSVPDAELPYSSVPAKRSVASCHTGDVALPGVCRTNVQLPWPSNIASGTPALEPAEGVPVAWYGKQNHSLGTHFFTGRGRFANRVINHDLGNVSKTISISIVKRRPAGL